MFYWSYDIKIILEQLILFLFNVNGYEDPSGASATLAEKEEADARSIYVGNVRFTSLSYSSSVLHLSWTGINVSLFCWRNDFVLHIGVGWEDDFLYNIYIFTLFSAICWELATN